MNLYESIFERHSVRTFTGQAPGIEIINRIVLPSHDNYRIVNVDSAISGGIGSYGVIKDAAGWLALVSDGSGAAELRCAMEAERIVLYLCTVGLGTCWVSGTFKSSEAEKKAELTPGEKVSAVIAYGYAAPRKRVLDRLTPALVGSSKRKSAEQMFVIDKDAPAVYREVLEAVRRAPSAVNAQPWRIIVDKDGNALFSSATNNSNTMIDMGIALAHFMIATEHYEIKGRLEISETPTSRLIACWHAAND